jgi:hypothetical protein
MLILVIAPDSLIVIRYDIGLSLITLGSGEVVAACPKKLLPPHFPPALGLNDTYLRTYSSHHATTTSTLTSLSQRLNTISPISTFDRDLSMCVVIGNKISLLDTNIRTATHEAPWTSPSSASPRLAAPHPSALLPSLRSPFQPQDKTLIL